MYSEVRNHEECKEDTHQHHFSETPVVAGCGVRAVGTNESNTYRRTEQKTRYFKVRINSLSVEEWNARVKV